MCSCFVEFPKAQLDCLRVGYVIFHGGVSQLELDTARFVWQPFLIRLSDQLALTAQHNGVTVD
jgi:hypothetical protein